MSEVLSVQISEDDEQHSKSLQLMLYRFFYSSCFPSSDNVFFSQGEVANRQKVGKLLRMSRVFVYPGLAFYERIYDEIEPSHKNGSKKFVGQLHLDGGKPADFKYIRENPVGVLRTAVQDIQRLHDLCSQEDTLVRDISVFMGVSSLVTLLSEYVSLLGAKQFQLKSSPLEKSSQKLLCTLQDFPYIDLNPSFSTLRKSDLLANLPALKSRGHLDRSKQE